MSTYEEEYERIQQQIRRSESIESEIGEAKRESIHMKASSLQDHENSDDEKEENSNSTHTKAKQFFCIARYTKLMLLVGCWIAIFCILAIARKKTEKQILLLNDKIETMELTSDVYGDLVSIAIQGFLVPNRNVKANQNSSLPYRYLSIWMESIFNDNRTIPIRNISEEWTLSVVPPEYIDILPTQQHTHIFDMKRFSKERYETVAVKFKTNSENAVPFTVFYDLSPIDSVERLTFGAVCLVGLYVLIIFELVHKTIAATLAATSAIAILAAANEKPTVVEVTGWIDGDTLLLLFSMMMIVAIVADTGIFDYLAVFAYKITKGKIWPLISTLCIFTALVSSFLDNVTTVMLMTPVTIRLCEVMHLNPVPVLTAVVMYSNIGGAMTPIGDPPNLIITSNKNVVAAGVGFGVFTIHMSLGVIFVIIVVYGHLRFMFRNLDILRFDEPQEVQDLKHEIAIWKKTADSISNYSKDERAVRQTLMKKVANLIRGLKKKEIASTKKLGKYKATLEDLQLKYPIRDKPLLIKSGFCMIFAIGLFFLHSWPYFDMTLGWTAFFCVLLLLVLVETKNLDSLMARVEWSTLLFFAALFVFMEALGKLGLIAWVGRQTESIIMFVDEESRLAVAILLMLWVSAITGAFVDNVPLTTMMIKVATDLSANEKLKLPLQPLVWALAFGACLGGNGTLIGASANIVCAGVAEQHGYHFTFMKFFKIGFPILLSSTFTITAYLLIAHVLFEWNH